MIAILAAALLQIGVPEGTQVINPDGSIVLKQKRLSVDDVLHHKKGSSAEKEARKDARRHDREMEKAFRKMGADRRFFLPTGRHRAHGFKLLPPGSTRY